MSEFDFKGAMEAANFIIVSAILSLHFGLMSGDCERLARQLCQDEDFQSDFTNIFERNRAKFARDSYGETVGAEVRELIGQWLKRGKYV